MVCAMTLSEPQMFGTPFTYSGRVVVLISGKVVVLIISFHCASGGHPGCDGSRCPARRVSRLIHAEGLVRDRFPGECRLRGNPAVLPHPARPVKIRKQSAQAPGDGIHVGMYFEAVHIV